jgi:hypothetical protein
MDELRVVTLFGAMETKIMLISSMKILCYDEGVAACCVHTLRVEALLDWMCAPGSS